MIKKILKSILVLTVLLGTVGGATKAWFTSTVTAADNEITVGTLMLAVDSTWNHTYSGAWGSPNADIVVQDEDGVSIQYNNFEAWTNAEPGAYVAYSAEAGADTWDTGNYSIWMSIRNRGTLDLNYRAAVTGAWTNLPRAATDPACQAAYDLDGTGSDPTLVKVRNVHRYDVGVGSGCENHEECRNIRDGLLTGPWTPQSAGTHDLTADPVAGYYYGTDDGIASGTDIDLAPEEFVVYRVDLQLSETAGNCYQGATYQYDLVGEAKQLDGPAW